MIKTIWQKPSFLLLLLLLWAAFQFFIVSPADIVGDWEGWRQSDTQTIALNFLQPGSNIFYPQINWGGTGPGYVECEFQLYPALITAIMKVIGGSEWPGRLLNILFFALISIAMFHEFSRRFGRESALCGVAIFLTSRSTVFLSTSVMPDTISFMFYTFSLILFIHYTEASDTKTLLLSLCCSTLAALTKPTALHLGIIQFLLVLFTRPALLRKPILWLSWAIILATVAAYLNHAYSLYTTYGNSFGVIGGDSKFPTLNMLLVPFYYVRLTYMSFVWGIGPLGACAAIYLLFKRKVSSLEWAFIIGNCIYLLSAMQTTISRPNGPHYHIFTSFLGAWMATHAVSYLLKTKSFQRISAALSVTVILLILGTYILNATLRAIPQVVPGWTPPSIVATGKMLSTIVQPNELIIVRSSHKSRKSKRWGGGPINYADPRLFYMTRSRGWMVPGDIKGVDVIKEYVQMGAHYYVETYSDSDEPFSYPSLDSWLKENARLVSENDHGRIYAFNKKES